MSETVAQPEVRQLPRRARIVLYSILGLLVVILLGLIAADRRHSAAAAPYPEPGDARVIFLK